MENYDYEEMSRDGYECQCEGAGHCPLLQKDMTEHLHHLCKTNEPYRKRFLENAMKRGVTSYKARKEYSSLLVKKNELDKLADAAIKEMEDSGINLDENDSSRGLGDTIEKVLSKFGITQEKIEKIAGAKGCGCGKRKQWFNKIFSYKKGEANE